MQIIIVTGVSGSGKSTVLNILEDIGYYCIDNMPPALILKFAELCANTEEKISKVAFVADVRSGDFFSELKETIVELKNNKYNVKVLILDSTDDAIIRRYKETRRKHPLDEKANGNIAKAIELERKMLLPINSFMDYYIDTSNLSSAQCREQINSLFLESNNDYMHIDIRSFGFKYGPMTDADLIFDVRCLPNPYYIPELKEKTGLDKDVSEYVMKFDDAKTLLGKLTDLIDFLIPLYQKEGKAQLVAAFGCTGGKHRSVTFAEAVAKHLHSKGFNVRISHRDIDKH
ncbi:MAG: RNase adapter RapZ [Oscillospiraceae bacterium]